MLGTLATFAGTAIRYSPLWAGAALIVLGLWLLFPPLALIVAGGFLIGVYMRLTGGK